MSGIGKRYIMSVALTAELAGIVGEPDGTMCWDNQNELMMVHVAGAWVPASTKVPSNVGLNYAYVDAAARTADVSNRKTADIGFEVTGGTTLVHNGAAWVAISAT